MAKEWFVLAASRVVYPPGHYDEEGALATARAYLRAHPGATVRIVRTQQTLVRPEAERGDTRGRTGAKPGA